MIPQSVQPSRVTQEEWGQHVVCKLMFVLISRQTQQLSWQYLPQAGLALFLKCGISPKRRKQTSLSCSWLSDRRRSTRLCPNGMIALSWPSRFKTQAVYQLWNFALWILEMIWIFFFFWRNAQRGREGVVGVHGKQLMVSRGAVWLDQHVPPVLCHQVDGHEYSTLAQVCSRAWSCMESTQASKNLRKPIGARLDKLSVLFDECFTPGLVCVAKFHCWNPHPLLAAAQTILIQDHELASDCGSYSLAWIYNEIYQDLDPLSPGEDHDCVSIPHYIFCDVVDSLL